MEFYQEESLFSKNQVVAALINKAKTAASSYREGALNLFADSNCSDLNFLPLSYNDMFCIRNSNW